jgi:hypothetical protein
VVSKSIQGCREDIQQLSIENRKLNQDQIGNRSTNTLAQIDTDSKVTMEDFWNLNRVQHMEIQRRFDELEERRSSRQAIAVSNSKAMNGLEMAVRQFMFVFEGFSVAVPKLLRFGLRIVLETHTLVQEMHYKILRAPALGKSDSIQFTDALGRTESLHYQYVRHWSVFEAMLKCQFKGLPGEKLVGNGQYHLLDTKRKELVIDRSKWERSVFPGADISMSMIILGMLFDNGSCPKCGAQNSQQSIESTFIIW